MNIKKIIRWIFLAFFIGVTVYYFFPDTKLPPDTQIDSIIVYKSKRQLMAYSNGQLIKTYTISLGRNPIGHKEHEGDKKTPEGIYSINAKNSGSGYHKNLGISYPNEHDIKNAESTGKRPGGEVKIHGLKNGIGFIGKFQRWWDWTAGCIAVTDEEVDELYNSVTTGIRIEIKP